MTIRFNLEQYMPKGHCGHVNYKYKIVDPIQVCYDTVISQVLVKNQAFLFDTNV